MPGKTNGTENIVIQERIEKALHEEFERLLKESGDNKLLKAIIGGRLSLEELEKEFGIE